jgi:hypothetical protein
MEMTAADAAYRELLIEELPRAIHQDREHQKYPERVEALLDKKKHSAAENRLLELRRVGGRVRLGP